MKEKQALDFATKYVVCCQGEKITQAMVKEFLGEINLILKSGGRRKKDADSTLVFRRKSGALNVSGESQTGAGGVSDTDRQAYMAWVNTMERITKETIRDAIEHLSPGGFRLWIKGFVGYKEKPR